MFITAQSGSPYEGTDCYIQKSNGAIGTYISSDGEFKYSSTQTLADDTWSFCVWVFYKHEVSGTVKVSVNGANLETLFTGDTGTANLLYGDGDVLIGKWQGGNVFGGHIDEVSLWNTALSEGDISALFSARGTANLNDDGNSANL